MKILYSYMKDIPSEAKTDGWLYEILKQGIGINQLCEQIEKGEYDDIVLHTYNPLIPCFLTDEYGKNHIWFTDNRTNEIKLFAEDEHLMSKLKWGSCGEALCDTFYVS